MLHFSWSNPTYFSVQTISSEVLGEFLHVARETPESVDLWVKNLQEPTAQVIHSLSITDLWINNQDKYRINKEAAGLMAQHTVSNAVWSRQCQQT